jgi:hypothetical protein
MSDWKDDLKELIAKEEQREAEVQRCVDENTEQLKKSRDQIDAFFRNEVVPALEDLKSVLEPEYKKLSVEYPADCDPRLCAASLTMSRGAKLAGQARYTNECVYILELEPYAKKAKGKLVMKDVVPGQARNGDFLIAEQEICPNGDADNVFGIGRAAIRSNFLQLLRRDRR